MQWSIKVKKLYLLCWVSERPVSVILVNKRIKIRKWDSCTFELQKCQCPDSCLYYYITCIITVIFILLAFENYITWQLRIALTVCPQTGETGRGGNSFKNRQMFACVFVHACMAYRIRLGHARHAPPSLSD